MSAPPKAACVLMDECLTIVRLPCDTAVAKLLGLRRGSKAECTLGRCRSACMPPAVHASVCQRRQRELIHNIKITAPARPSGTGQVPQHGLPMGRMPTGARVARIHDAGVRRASAARKPRRACGAGVGCTHLVHPVQPRTLGVHTIERAPQPTQRTRCMLQGETMGGLVPRARPRRAPQAPGCTYASWASIFVTSEAASPRTSGFVVLTLGCFTFFPASSGAPWRSSRTGWLFSRARPLRDPFPGHLVSLDT